LIALLLLRLEQFGDRLATRRFAFSYLLASTSHVVF
jgi:hypothetical protein